MAYGKRGGGRSWQNRAHAKAMAPQARRAALHVLRSHRQIPQALVHRTFSTERDQTCPRAPSLTTMSLSNAVAIAHVNSKNALRPQRPGQSTRELQCAIAGAQLFTQDRRRA